MQFKTQQFIIACVAANNSTFKIQHRLVPHRSIALRLCRHSDGDITKNHLISGNKLLISSYTYVTDSSQGVPLFVL